MGKMKLEEIDLPVDQVANLHFLETVYFANLVNSKKESPIWPLLIKSLGGTYFSGDFERWSHECKCNPLVFEQLLDNVEHATPSGAAMHLLLKLNLADSANAISKNQLLSFSDKYIKSSERITLEPLILYGLYSAMIAKNLFEEESFKNYEKLLKEKYAPLATDPRVQFIRSGASA